MISSYHPYQPYHPSNQPMLLCRITRITLPYHPNQPLSFCRITRITRTNLNRINLESTSVIISNQPNQPNQPLSSNLHLPTPVPWLTDNLALRARLWRRRRNNVIQLLFSSNHDGIPALGNRKSSSIFQVRYQRRQHL